MNIRSKSQSTITQSGKDANRILEPVMSEAVGVVTQNQGIAN
jgi:hypothetical protein